jgi:nitrate/TMAO reductase-like tetraheme cytochrome c subunit
MFKKIRTGLKNFFFPPAGSPRWVRLIPFAALGVLTASLLVGGAYAWQYTNSSPFCGTSCHTMPPEYAAYQMSPHAHIACVECHIGREFVGNQIMRKAGDLRHIVAMTFTTYEYPIMAGNMRPARDTCETCHTPEKFSDDSMRVISHFQSDKDNTPYQIYLILKTGGGTKREGMGQGIHWHIENQVYYYASDAMEQNIPYVKVIDDTGKETEFVDVASGFDAATVDETKLKRMDCITCHNRITHRVYTPEESVDRALQVGTISSEIPFIRREAVNVLRGVYATQAEGLAAIGKLADYYETNFPDYYAANQDKVEEAINEIKVIFTNSVFIDQKSDWNSHPNNIGHFDSAGCFRCHDGKHLNSDQQAIRLECNLCHSIPIVTGPQDFVTKIELSKGPEPQSHLNTNWISLHNQAFDETCSACHTTEGAGTTANTSFCSNSACHGSVFSFAGFDAPKLREILQSQLPTPEPVSTPAPVVGDPTYIANIAPIFNAKCVMCHGTTAAGGLNLTSYASIMAGGKDGPVIILNDSANSLLVKVQSEKHFANLSPEELLLVEQWIDAGAPEQ